MIHDNITRIKACLSHIFILGAIGQKMPSVYSHDRQDVILNLVLPGFPAI